MQLRAELIQFKFRFSLVIDVDRRVRTGEPEASFLGAHRQPWAPSISLAVRLLFLIRIAWTMYF